MSPPAGGGAVARAASVERDRIDAVLLTQVAAGNRDAFAELYDRFAPPLYGAAMQILRATRLRSKRCLPTATMMQSL